MSIGRPEVCVGALAIEAEEILLVRRANQPGRGQWALPGGRVEAGEAVVAAVVREFGEETGLECVCGSLVAWVERMAAEPHFVILDFWVDVISRNQPKAGPDSLEVSWVPINDLLNWDLVDGLMDFLTEHGIAVDSAPLATLKPLTPSHLDEEFDGP